MPRLSSKHHLAARRSLCEVRSWLYELDPDDVVAVSRFFAPTKHFTEAEALAHRRTVTAKDPSLPHRVGKIMRKRHVEASLVEKEIARATDTATPAPIAIGRPGHEQQLIVRAVRRPGVDVRQLAQIFIQDMRKPVGERLIDQVPNHDQDEAA